MGARLASTSRAIKMHQMCSHASDSRWNALDCLLPGSQMASTYACANSHSCKHHQRAAHRTGVLHTGPFRHALCLLAQESQLCAIDSAAARATQGGAAKDAQLDLEVGVHGEYDRVLVLRGPPIIAMTARTWTGHRIAAGRPGNAAGHKVCTSQALTPTAVAPRQCLWHASLRMLSCMNIYMCRSCKLSLALISRAPSAGGSVLRFETAL